MKCSSIIYSDHAVTQMFKRDVSTHYVEQTLINGEIIKNYFDDKLFPSCLLLATIDQRIIHLVVARNPENDECVIVTVYIPDPLIWENDFRSKK